VREVTSKSMPTLFTNIDRAVNPRSFSCVSSIPQNV